MEVLKRHDLGTWKHCQRVALLAKGVCREIELTPLITERIETAARLHDIGKINIDPELINQAQKLSQSQIQTIRSHPNEGVKFIPDTHEWQDIRIGIQDHHELWNGTGYPNQRHGEQISLTGRIITVCDVFDTITSDRPYAKARSTEDAVAELQRFSGRQFDPRLVEKFVQSLNASSNAAYDCNIETASSTESARGSNSTR